MKEEVRSVVCIEAKSDRDIGRIAASIMTMGQPIYILHFFHAGKHIYGILANFHDFWNLKGVPIFYFFSSENELGTYLLLKSDDEGERIEWSDRAKRGWVSVPVMSLKEKPPFIEF